MKLKINLIIMLLSVTYLFCIEVAEKDRDLNHYEFSFNYSGNMTDIQRIKFCLPIHINSRYNIENGGFNFVWIEDNLINKGNKNYSVTPILDLLISAYQSTFTTNDIKGNLLFFPSFLLNSTHNVLFNKMYDPHTNNGLNFAFFIKNNTDLFVFQKVNWIQLSPGFGIKLYKGFHGNLVYMTLSIGYEKKYMYTKENNFNEKNAFISIGLYGYME